jgi:hypothetical protein
MDETEQRGGACAMHKLCLRRGAELGRHSGMSGAAASTKTEPPPRLDSGQLRLLLMAFGRRKQQL